MLSSLSLFGLVPSAYYLGTYRATEPIGTSVALELMSALCRHTQLRTQL